MKIAWTLALLMTAYAQTAASQSPVYRASSSSPDNSLYQFDGDSALLSAQATVRIRSVRDVPPRSWAAFNLAMSADTLVYRYVTLSAEIKVTSAPLGASLWTIVAGDGDAYASPTTRDKAVKGTTDWTPVALTVRIDPRAKNIGFGIRFDGSGTMEARNVRLVAAPRVVAAAAPMARAYLDSAITLAKARAYWSDTVTWSVVDSQVQALARGATTTAETHDAIRYLLSRLGDHHSFFLPPVAASPIQPTGGPVPGAFTAVDVRTLGDGIARVTMPGYTQTDSATARQYVTQLHASLAAVRSATTCGWVLDLRNNQGGNMWPMLGGLHPFLGDGDLGFFVARDGTRSAPWKARVPNGLTLTPELRGLGSAPVAVLYGPYTASSGEAVAVAFVGRPNTRSFGTSTGGLANGNENLRLADGATMLVMHSLDADRRGKVYGKHVEPDERIDGSSASGGTTLQAAVAWLKGACAESATRVPPRP